MVGIVSPQSLSIRVIGKPEPWSRPRPGNGCYYSPHKDTAWYANVLREAARVRPNQPLTGPLELAIDFMMPRPKSRPNDYWHTVKPDKSNLEKLVEDTLKDAGWMKDDCQICTGDVRKRYVLDGEDPGALIVVRAVETPAQIVSDSRTK